jgi:hypothetical protein
MYEMDRLLQEEYMLMQREAAQKQRSAGRGRGGGSVDGEKVHRINASDARKAGNNPSIISRGGTWVDVITGGLALGSGRYAEAISIALTGWFDDALSIWDKSPEAQMFAVSFGGVLITAGSRRQLRRKLSRQKQKRLQLIMNHVRKMGLVRGASDSLKISHSPEKSRIHRLREKKKRAIESGPARWSRTVSPQGQQTGWRSRSLDLRERVRGKKKRAQQLWIERVGYSEKMIN